MKLYSIALRLILIAGHLAVRTQVQAIEDANADDPFSNNWQSDDTTNIADEFSAVSDDDGAETPTTTQQQHKWSVTEPSTMANNQETIAFNLITTAMLQSHSDDMATVTDPLYQYEMSHASLTPVSIISTEANTRKTSHQATQRDRLTTFEATLANNANGLPSNAAEEVTSGTDAGSTNNNNFIEVTAVISDNTQGNDASKFATVSPVSMSSISSGTTTFKLPLFSTEDAQQSWSTTLKPTRTTTVSSFSSNAADALTDGADGDNTNNQYFTEVTATEPNEVSEEVASSEIATTLQASVYSIDSDETTISVANASADEMQRSTSTTSEPTKASTASGFSTNAAQEFTDGSYVDRTNSEYFTEVKLTEPGVVTNENVASKTVTASLTSMYSIDSSATTIKLTYASAEEMQWTTSTTLAPTKTSTQRGFSSNAVGDFTDGPDGANTNSQYSTEVTATEPDDETKENTSSETVTASLVSMHGTDDGAITVEVTQVSDEEMQQSMSTALESTRTTPGSETSTKAAEEFTAGAKDDSTSNYYFTEETLTKTDVTTEENVASETFTASLTEVSSVDSAATTIELSYSSALKTRWSRSTTSKPAEVSTANGVSLNSAAEVTDGTDGDGTNNHYFTEVTLTEPGDRTAGSVASEIVTAPLASMHSFGNDGRTAEMTHASAEETQLSMSTTFEPAATSITRGISSNAVEEVTYGTDGDNTDKPITEVTLTESDDQTEGYIASETVTASLTSLYSADSAATTVEVAYTSAEKTQWSRSTTSEPTTLTTATGIPSNTAEEFTDGTDVASSKIHYSTEITFTEAENSDGNVAGKTVTVAGETVTASLAPMYSVGSDAKTIEVTNALAEETHWSMSTALEPTEITTARGISLYTADEFTKGNEATRLPNDLSTSDSYFTDVILTEPSDETERNVASETVTAPLSSMYSLDDDVATIKVTYASDEIAQRSSSEAVEADITTNAISMSSSAASELTDDTTGGITDNKYFTVVTLTNPGEESDGNVDSQATTTSLALMSSIDSGATKVEVTHTYTHEDQRSSLTTLEPMSVTNKNVLSSNAAQWSSGAPNENGFGSSHFTEQTSTVNGETVEDYVSNDLSSTSLASTSSDGKTASTNDLSPTSVEDVQWSKTTILEGKGTTFVNTHSSSTKGPSPFVTSNDNSLTDAIPTDDDITIEDFDASATPTAETATGLDVSLTNPSNETETTPTSSLGPSIDNDTIAEIRRNNSVVVSLSMSLTEYTEDFDYKFRSTVAQAANDYCKRNACYGSGSSSGDDGNGGRPRVRRAAVTPAPASPAASGSTTASPAPQASSATALAVLFTIADVGILPGYPVSNSEGGIDVATYLSPPAGLASSVGSAYTFITVSGVILVAIISANQGAVADALGVNITGIIRLPEKVALDGATSTKAAASTAAAVSTAVESSFSVPLVASLVSVAAVLLAIAAAVLVVKKLKRQGSASVSPSITKLNVDDRPSTSTSGDMWYAEGSTEIISQARRNRNLLEELDVSTSMWYENSLPQETSMGRRRVYRIAKDVPTLQYSPPEDTSYFQCISPPPSYSALPPIRNNR